MLLEFHSVFGWLRWIEERVRDMFHNLSRWLAIVAIDGMASRIEGVLKFVHCVEWYRGGNGGNVKFSQGQQCPVLRALAAEGKQYTETP
jgi:hypothetical protein